LGLTGGERGECNYGEAVWSWYTSGFKDARATNGPQSRYGGLFDLLALAVQHISPFTRCETKPLLTMLIAIVGLIATWKTARLLGGAAAGLLASVLLLL